MSIRRRSAQCSAGRTRPVLGTVLAVYGALAVGLEDVIVFDAEGPEDRESPAWKPSSLALAGAIGGTAAGTLLW